MRELNFEREINLDKLDRELKTAGVGVWGVSVYGPERPISVWVEDEIGEAQEARIAEIVAAHDATPEVVPEPLLEAQIVALQDELSVIQQRLAALLAKVRV